MKYIITGLTKVRDAVEADDSNTAEKLFRAKYPSTYEILDVTAPGQRPIRKNRKVGRMDIYGTDKTIPMRVLLIPAGEKSPNYPGMESAGKDMIEFYDFRYSHTPDGQFITRYYVETLMLNRCPQGLDLQGSVPEWKITAQVLDYVLSWVELITYDKPF